jgi:CpeT protein
MPNYYATISRINKIEFVSMSKRLLSGSLLLLALVLIVKPPVYGQLRDRDIRDLAAWMTGSFDTFSQVNDDEEADSKYRHIRAILHVLSVPIAEMKDGFSFYVENQAAESRTKPYRQRVYLLSRIDGKITLQVFRIRDDKTLINSHKDTSLLKGLSFDRLTKEAGCDLVYTRTDKNTFKGSNFGNKSCKSTLHGATHTNSESIVTPTRWTNLDQGFDDVGSHKWGPPPGTIGHIFIKRK